MKGYLIEDEDLEIAMKVKRKKLFFEYIF